jgi:hypothetical protein
MLRNPDPPRPAIGSWLGTPVGTLLVYAIAIAFKLWLISDYSITAGYAPHDDYLFVRQALSVLEWNWLGPLNHLTLGKGPFFPMWLAAMHLLSLPYILALQLSYLTACVTFLLALRPFNLARPWQILIFTMFWFSPASFAATDFRVERSALYPSLVLLTVAFAVGLAIRSWQSLRPSVAWPIGLGLSFAAVWLTREEGVWLLPTLLLILVASLKRRRILSSWILSATVFIACLTFVAGLNHIFYGRFMIIGGRDPAFVDAYRAMTRAGDDSPRLMVPMSLRTIERAASVSPAFAEIRPFLLESFPTWRGFAKNTWTEMYPDGVVKQTLAADNDAIGGYFVWEFLESVERAGYYKSAAVAHEYYARLARELNSACEAKRIVCRRAGEDLVPPFTNAPTQELVRSFARAVRLSFILPSFDPLGECRHVDLVVLNEFSRLTRSTIRCGPALVMSLKGWVVAKNGEATLVAYDRDLKLWRLPGFAPSPDVASHFKGTEWSSTHPENARFEAEFPCAGCDLALEINGVAVRSAPAAQWQPGCTDNAVFQMCIDEILQTPDSEPRLGRFTAKVKRNSVALFRAVYRYGVLAFAASALLLSMRQIRTSSRSRLLAITLAGACVLAVLVRAFILAWVDVVSFPSIVFQYTHASYGLLLAGTALLMLAAVNTHKIALNDLDRRDG